MLARLGCRLDDGEMRVMRGRHLHEIHLGVGHDLHKIIRRGLKVERLLRLQSTLLPHVARPLEHHVGVRTHIGQILRMRELPAAYLR